MAADVKEKESNATIVSVATAMNVAETFIKSSNYNQKWSQTQLVFFENLYDIDESLLGYYFIVRDNGESIGHIIVSATEDRGPVLQYGDGASNSKKTGLKAYYVGGIIHEKNAADVIQKAKTKNIDLKPMASNSEISRSEWESSKSDIVALSSPISKE
ncbi:hypothetical protein [Paenibacillus beijingensis]|nr:hypothetical protein [Paenibacillus beijingensis]